MKHSQDASTTPCGDAAHEGCRLGKLFKPQQPRPTQVDECKENALYKDLEHAAQSRKLDDKSHGSRDARESEDGHDIFHLA